MSIGAIGYTNFSFAWMARTGALPQFGRTPTAASLSNQQRSHQTSGLSQSLDRLFDALGGALNAANARRDALDGIKSELAALRSALQSAGRQGVSTGARALTSIVEDLELTVERAIYGNVDVLETRPVYETRDVYATRDVYETRPVYEQRDIRATIVTGTRDLSGFSRISNAGIDNGADFSVQVGSGALATVKFSSATRIALTIGGTTTNFNFASNGGEWRTGLLDALNSIADLSAQYTAEGRLQLQTTDAQSLTIADVANGFFDFSDSPLASLGLTAGTTQSSVVGTEQVQIGTEEVVVGQEQYVAGQEQVEVGTEQVKVGTEQAQIGTVQFSAGTRALTVGFDRAASAGGTARVENIQGRLRELAVAVNALASSSQGGPSPSADGAQALADQLSALLESPDFGALASGADTGAFDRVMKALDDALSRADGLYTELARESAGLAESGQGDLAALLLGAAGLQTVPGDPVGLARLTAAMLRGSPSGLLSSNRMSFSA